MTNKFSMMCLEYYVKKDLSHDKIICAVKVAVGQVSNLNIIQLMIATLFFITIKIMTHLKTEILNTSSTCHGMAMVKQSKKHSKNLDLMYYGMEQNINESVFYLEKLFTKLSIKQA